MSAGTGDGVRGRRVSVALSGGGHRASAWALGTLYGILLVRDAEHAKAPDRERIEIVTVASVSGGSLTNGVVARETRMRASDLDSITTTDFVSITQPLIDTIARKGIIPAKGRTLGYVRGAVGLLIVTAVAAIVTVGIAVTVARGRPTGFRLVTYYGIALGVFWVFLFSAAIARARRGRTHVKWPWLPAAAVLAILVLIAVSQLVVANVKGDAAVAATIGCIAILIFLGYATITILSRRGGLTRVRLTFFVRGAA